MFEKSITKTYSIPEARKKIEHFCAYQERCQQEVRDKLYDYGLHRVDVENIISNLIEDNFINEERFAIAYAQGKFRMKSWGRNKIRYALKQKKISPRLIITALSRIDADEYDATLLKLLETKLRLIAKKPNPASLQKLTQYALGKGYEYDLIKECLKTLK